MEPAQSMTTFGQRLRAARIRRGWTQSELAKASGLTQSAIGNYESGHRAGPNGAALVDLATALGISPEWLQRGAAAKSDDKVTVTIDHPWPFASVKFEDYQALTRTEKDILDAMVNTFVCSRLNSR